MFQILPQFSETATDLSLDFQKLQQILVYSLRK